MWGAQQTWVLSHWSTYLARDLSIIASSWASVSSSAEWAVVSLHRALAGGSDGRSSWEVASAAGPGDAGLQLSLPVWGVGCGCGHPDRKPPAPPSCWSFWAPGSRAQSAAWEGR